MAYSRKRLMGLALAVLALTGMTLTGAEARPVKAGTLDCQIAPGVGLIFVSRKEVRCRFQSTRGRPEFYRGWISKLGIDIGVTGGGRMIWAVYEPSDHPRTLGGRYTGASAEASLIGGLGANLLVGGSDGSVALQPLSVQGQVGLNIAAGVGDLVLERVR